MKTYTGERDRVGACKVWRVEANGKRRPLPMRKNLYNHSPTGFEWGYNGSGPAQLALALLADVLDNDDLAVRWHQPFKFKVIGNLPRAEPWRMSEVGIREIVANLIAERADELIVIPAPVGGHYLSRTKR